MEEAKIIAYFQKKLSADEATEVEKWCDASEENKQLARQIYYLTIIDNCRQSHDRIQVDKAWKTFRETRKKRRMNLVWKKMLWPAAAFLTGILFTAGFTYNQLSESMTYAVSTNPGQRAQFILPDGSRVWLNSSTQLSYHTSFWRNERNVRLTGEAYFDIAHNPDVPFVVQANEVTTEVLGTKFNIRARENEHHVVTTLLQGAIRVASENTEEVTLKPGERLDINVLNNTATLSRPPKAKDILMWINGKATFTNATFGEITGCLEKIYNINIQFDSQTLQEERFTCTLNLDDHIEQVLNILKLTRHFDYEVNEDTIKIKEKK